MSTSPTLVAPLPARSAFGALRARFFGVRPVSRKRKAIALAVALAADAVQMVLWPVFAGGAASPPDDALDAVVAVILCVTLGFRARLLVALAVELVPGADLLPTWTAVVATIPSEGVAMEGPRPPSPPSLEPRAAPRPSETREGVAPSRVSFVDSLALRGRRRLP